jgi:hypothetical protein
VSFLFISTLFIPRGKKRLLTEMIDYCNKNGYQYFIIEDYQKKRLNFLPFYRAINLYFDHKNKYKNFLNSNSIDTLITTYQKGFFYDCLMGVANSLGVKTMMLGWVVTNPYHQLVTKEYDKIAKKLTKEKILLFIKRHIYHRLLEKFTNLISRGGAQKIGVINQFSYNVLKKKGVPENKISIVGYANFDLAKKTLDLLNNSPETKKALAKKYDIDINKKNIIIYSSPFYRNGFISPQKFIEYYHGIIKTVREVFSTKEADILFKLHPAEELSVDSYAIFKDMQVKLYRDISNEELISFGDLYIAHWSTANFVPIAMEKDCIFINLIKLPFADLYKEMFSIKKFISEENEFKKLLIDFKNGTLIKQYDKNSILSDGKCLARIIHWIN